MGKYGFLSVLEEEMDKHFHYDYAINWDKKNHAVEVSFILEVANEAGEQIVDEAGEVVEDAIALEEFILFYQPEKTRFQAEDYLVALPFEAKKGFSREFLAYFATYLNQVADEGLDGILDFLADETAEDFVMTWDEVAFEEGRKALSEGEMFPYPRY